VGRASWVTDMGQLQFVHLQLNYNYIVFGQLQLQLPIDIVKDFKIFFLTLLLLGLG